MLYIVLLRDETVNVAQTHDIWIDIHPFVDLCQGGRDNEPSKMNGVYDDRRRATQASLPHIHIYPRPYGYLANFLLKDHNHAPTVPVT